MSFCRDAGIAKKEAVLILGVVAIGIAVGESLFLIYPDLMFRNTGVDSQSGAGTDVPLIIDPNEPIMTERVGANGTN